MRRLFLHVGHGKTGTSYLQSCFARSRAALRAAGVTYPPGQSDQHAARGAVTSGNGYALAQGLRDAATRARLAKPLRQLEGDVLFSSEFLFHHLAFLSSPEALLDFADRAGFEMVEILLFIRDPLDNIRSAYLQNVQRSGLTGHIDEMATRFSMPMRSNKMARVYRDPRIRMTVRNYSRVKTRLIEETEAWLNLPPGALDRPPQTRVNRSLTAAEMEMQRVFNGAFGASGHLFADHVVEALPDLEPDYPMLSRPARRLAHDRNAPAMRRLNKLIPPEHAYRFDLEPDAPPAEADAEDGEVTMTEAQIDAIVDALARRIGR